MINDFSSVIEELEMAVNIDDSWENQKRNKWEQITQEYRRSKKWRPKEKDWLRP